MAKIIKASDIVAALEKAEGFISVAADSLSKAYGRPIDYNTVWARIQRTPSLKEAHKAIEERHKDFAESKLMAAIKAGESWATCFFLKCKAKDRGYIEQHITELVGQGGGPVQLKVVYDDKPFQNPSGNES